jgi:hypothetical protein
MNERIKAERPNEFEVDHLSITPLNNPMGNQKSKVKIENKQLIESYNQFKANGLAFLPQKFRLALTAANVNEWAQFADGLTQLNLNYLSKFVDR